MKIFNKKSFINLLGGRLPEMKKIVKCPQSSVDQVFFSPILNGSPLRECKLHVFWIHNFYEPINFPFILFHCPQYPITLNRISYT